MTEHAATTTPTSGLSAKVLTVSDGVVAGTREDRSGRALVDRLLAEGFAVVEHRVVAYGIADVGEALVEMADGFEGLIVTTGGTGLDRAISRRRVRAWCSTERRPGWPKRCGTSIHWDVCHADSPVREVRRSYSTPPARHQEPSSVSKQCSTWSLTPFVSSPGTDANIPIDPRLRTSIVERIHR